MNRLHRVAPAALLIAVALLWAADCPAEEDDQTDEQPQGQGDTPAVSLPEVVVQAATVNESLQDPPAFVQTIDVRQYAGRLATTEQMLSSAVGVHLRDFGGLGQLSTVSIRGASSDQVAVLIDGVRVSPAAGGGVDFSSIPADHVERIEVLRGGESALYGEGAMGGVVNIVTRKVGTGSANTLGASYGSLNTLRLSAVSSRRRAALRCLAGANYLHSDGDFQFINNNGTELDDADDFNDARRNNAFDSRGLLLKAGWEINEKIDLAGQNELVGSRRGLPGLVTFPTPHARAEQVRNVSALRLALAEPIPAMSFTSTASLVYSQESFDDPRGESTGEPLASEQRQYAPELEQTAQYVWGKHQILRLSGTYRQDLLYDPQFDDPRRESWSAALIDQISPWGKLLCLVPALRLDAVQGMDQQWSPKLGAALKPLSWLALKANAGRSFRAPNFYELYFNQGFVIGNPELKPERSWSVDAGAALQTRRYSAELAGFYYEVQDLIEYVLLSGFRYKPFNIGKAMISGIEARAALRPIDQLALSGSYTFVDARDATDEPNRRGMQIPGRPRHKAFGRLETLLDPVTLFVEYFYVSGNYVTAANTKLLDPRHVVNAGLTTQAGPHFQMGAEVKNLNDDRISDVRGFPLPGRSVFLTLQAAF